MECTNHEHTMRNIPEKCRGDLPSCLTEESQLLFWILLGIIPQFPEDTFSLSPS